MNERLFPERMATGNTVPSLPAAYGSLAMLEKRTASFLQPSELCSIVQTAKPLQQESIFSEGKRRLCLHLFDNAGVLL